MKKPNITPEKAKLISTLLISIIFMTIILSISSAYTRRMLNNAKGVFFDNIETTLDGFEQIVSIQLNSYSDYLHAYYIDINRSIPDFDTEKIFQFIQEYNDTKLPDFMDFYYLEPDGTTYLSDGSMAYMNPKNHQALLGDNDIYISGVCLPQNKSEYLFCIERPLIKDNKVYGAIGASIIINQFLKRIFGYKIGTRESFILIDKQGRFLAHSRPDVIGKTYSSPDPKYESSSSVSLAKNPATTIEAEADDGKKVYLVTAKIPRADWTLAIRISMSEIDEVYAPQKKIELLIILFAIFIILTLIFIEAKTLDFFQKKQLIATVYDPLTGLWTRQRFENEAAKMIKNQKSKFMLIEADIRGFKFINQNYGEEAADRLILYYSKFLYKHISDYHAIIGRGFADHFYILLKITSVRRAMTTFKEAVKEFSEELKSYEIPFFPKFGISFLVPGERTKDTTIQSLIGQASFAKSTIKDNILTQYSVYNSKLLEKINEERFIESHMQEALTSKEFFVMYQPKINLANDKIVGAEALVRWKSPKLGLMTPDKFIPLFERNGFITKLDYYVYEEVFKFMQTQLNNGNFMVPISVNMSRNHNKPEKFMHDFMDIFKKYSIPPEMIQLEILERSVMDNETLQDITNMLHKEGFSVAMDDFGSGESSLNMLTKIPVDVLKFDREFLNASTDEEGRIDKKSEKFIHILIDLSKNLEKQTVFEGVETQAQRDFLRSIECDQAQGYFYSQPLSEQDFVEFIKLHS